MIKGTKKLAVLAGLLIPLASLNASTTDVTVVMKADQSQSVYNVTEDGAIYFDSNDNLIISKNGSNQDAVIALSSIGKVLFSENTATNIASVANESAVSLYPNPASDAIYVSTKAENVKVSIYSATGVLVKEQTVSNGEAINVSNLAKGIYVVKVNNDYLKFSKL